jgi:succinoglycan biosynthesis transport protein ExoP
MRHASPSDQARPLTLGDLAATCWRHRWSSLAAGVLVAATVVLATFRLTPLYEASASLAVDRGRKPVEFQFDPSSGTVEYSLLNTQRDMILAAPVLEETLKASGLLATPAYAESGEPDKLLKDRIKVTTRRDSWVINVSLRDEDGERARFALECLLKAYAASQTEQKSDKANLALTFLSNQVATARERLEEARRREQAFRIEKAIISTDVDTNPVAQRLDLLNKERAALDQQLAESQAVLQQLGEARARPEADERIQAMLRIETVNRHPVVMEQQKLLYELNDKAVVLVQKYGEKHPRMQEIREQIATKKQHLAEAVALAESTVQAHQQEVSIQLKDLRMRSAAIERELNDYRTSLASLQALASETKSREDLFNRLFTRLGEEEVASRLDAKQVTLFEKPKAAPRPVNIKKPLFAAAALFLGLVSAVIMALAAEALDRRVRGAPATQELTGLTLLGQLPFVSGLAVLGKGGDPEQPPLLAEAYRALRAALRLIRRDTASCQVLVITSSGPGEGKSTVSTRLGMSLAAAGSRVLLIDADLRKPSLHRQLGDSRERGFSFLLAGEQDITPGPTDQARLDFLPVGVRPPNPAELLHSPALKEALTRWRGAYDYILVDTPPLGLVSDALSLGELADGLLLVVRDRVTAKSTLRLVLDRLAPLSGKVLGLVFNAEQHENASYGYYYRSKYNYQYGYGGKPEAEKA